MTIQSVLSALVNAYIMGDITVTKQGRYHMSPPSGHSPVIEVEQADDMVIEIEPDWGIGSDRPQVGADNHRQKPRTKHKWGTRELAQYLRKTTERRVSVQNLRRLLSSMEVEKEDNGRWSFNGPEDRTVIQIVEAVQAGVYDSLVQEGVEAARKQQESMDEATVEHFQSARQEEIARRAQHLRRLRSIQESESSVE